MDCNLIKRYKKYANPANPRKVIFGWVYNYTVCSPNEYDSACFTLDEAATVAKNRQRKNNLPIIREWEK